MTVKGITEFIRAIVRPYLAAVALGGTLALLFLRIPIPDAWWTLTGGAMIFYFTQRHDEKKNGTNTTGTGN